MYKTVYDQPGLSVEVKAISCMIAGRHPEDVDEVKATSSTIFSGHPGDAEEETENVSSSMTGDALHENAKANVTESKMRKMRMNNSRLNSLILNRSRL